MSFFKNLLGKPAELTEPIFPGESFSIIKLDMPEGWALATVNEAYKNYPNKKFFPFLVGIELEIIDKNDNGHPTDTEAARLNEIQEEIETMLKEKQTVHSVARVTRNGARDILIYIDKLKLNDKEIDSICDKIRKERLLVFSIQKDEIWSAVSGLIK